ncbi:MAG: transposase [Rubrobacter sp.]|nr:transposase [Rubrobacter sp.]
MRESEGRDRDPSGTVLDSQVVRTTGVSGPERGFDGAQRIAGRRRYILADTGGHVLGVHVHAASSHDRDGSRELLTDELQG